MTRAPLSFELSAEITASPDEVFALLTTPERLTEIHPLVVGVRVEPPSSDGIVRFRVQDRLRIAGLFPVRFWYSVEMRAFPEERRAVFTSLAEPRVTTRTEYELREEGGHTRLLERSEITAPWGLRGFVLRSAWKAHEVTLRAIERRFSRGGRACS